LARSTGGPVARTRRRRRCLAHFRRACHAAHQAVLPPAIEDEAITLPIDTYLSPNAIIASLPRKFHGHRAGIAEPDHPHPYHRIEVSRRMGAMQEGPWTEGLPLTFRRLLA